MEIVCYLSKCPGPTQEQFANEKRICKELRMHFMSGKPLLLPSLDNVPSTAMWRDAAVLIVRLATGIQPPISSIDAERNEWLAQPPTQDGLLVGLDKINNSQTVILPECLDLVHENLQCNLC